jgi:hypothetical protein
LPLICGKTENVTNECMDLAQELFSQNFKNTNSSFKPYYDKVWIEKRWAKNSF